MVSVINNFQNILGNYFRPSFEVVDWLMSMKNYYDMPVLKTNWTTPVPIIK